MQIVSPEVAQIVWQILEVLAVVGVFAAIKLAVQAKAGS
jgi:hypothetical protein